jgi:hypothetical protein
MRTQDNRRNFTDANISELAILEKKYEVRDTKLPGLRVRVEGSGTKTFYFVYSFRGRPRCTGSDLSRWALLLQGRWQRN